MKRPNHIKALTAGALIVALVSAAFVLARPYESPETPETRVEAQAPTELTPFQPVALVDDVALVEVEDDGEADPLGEAEITTTVEATTHLPGQTTKKKPKQEEWKSAVLQIVTNFDKADITINNIPYPEYVQPGQEDGVVLPAGGPYDVRVTYNGKTKKYLIHLRPYETRLLIVELSGFQGSGATAAKPSPKPAPKAAPQAEDPKKDDEKEAGKVTVYSKPSGVIIIDGNKSSEKTPGTVEVENGRHEVQVEYEHGEVSEKKIVRVRQGSRIKLFFRARKAPAE